MTTASNVFVLLSGLALLVACGNESTAPPTPVASVNVMPAGASVVIGAALQLRAIVKDAAGNQLADRAVTWTSNAPTQATVSATGLVTGLALSDAVLITATSEGKSGSATVTVVINLTGEWNFTEEFSGTYEGRRVVCSDTGSYQFTQSGADVSGTTAQVGTCVGPVISFDNTAWSSPITQGRLSSALLSFRTRDCLYNGQVTGPPSPKLSGTLSCGDWRGAWEAVPGGAPVAAVVVRWDVQTVVGGTVQLVAVPRDAAGYVLSRAVSWSSDNPSAVTVSDNGLVTARAAGAARITATSEGKAGSAAITADLISFSAVSAGFYHSCGITPTGVAYCWGWGGDGQLGTGFRPPAAAPRASAHTPLAVTGGHTFAMVTTGWGHSCGVTTSGEAYCWGDNSSGQLGDGSRTGSLVPVRVTGGQSFASIAVRRSHTCGVTTANAVYCWGVNTWGQLGDGSRSDAGSSSPVLVAGGLLFQAVRAGWFHTCGVTTTNEAYCWGYGLAGQLGTGLREYVATTPAAVAGGHSLVAAASGWAHSCAISPDGAAYCWGTAGPLGDGSGVDQLAPAPVAGGLSFATTGRSMGAGGEHSCALMPAGAAYCWGLNRLGGIGDGSTIARSTPAPVSGGLNFATISAGLFHTCGVTTSAVAFCWGNDASGQIGATTTQLCSYDGTAYPCATAPVRVTGTVQPGPVAARVAGFDAPVQEANPSVLLRMLGPALRGPQGSAAPPRR